MEEFVINGAAMDKETGRILPVSVKSYERDSESSCATSDWLTLHLSCDRNGLELIEVFEKIYL